MRLVELNPYTNNDEELGIVLVFDCPCLNGSKVRVPFAKWKIENWPGDSVTIRPSVDCRPTHDCHFTITDGHVDPSNG